MNGGGIYVLSLIFYSRKNIRHISTTAIPAGTVLTCQNSGWFNCDRNIIIFLQLLNHARSIMFFSFLMAIAAVRLDLHGTNNTT
jgi:hypothetical protein